MRNNTRKRFMPVALVVAVMAIGAVAVAIALAGSSPHAVQAHGDSPGACETEVQRAVHDLISPNDPCPASTTPTTPTPTAAPGNGNGSTGTPFSLASETLPDEVRGCTIDADAGGKLYKGSQCNTSGDMLDVVFENSTGDDLQVVVYITGGSQIPGVQATNGKKGLNQVILDIAKSKGTVVEVKGSETITVNSAMRDDKGAVYLYAHRDAAQGIPINPNATTYPASPQFGVWVQFLGAPALGTDANNDGDVAGNEVRSRLDALVGATIGASPIFTANVVDGMSDELPVAKDQEEVQIRATIKDAGGNYLEDQEVTMTLASNPEGIVPLSPEKEDTDAMGRADFEVDVPETDAFRIAATFMVDDLNVGSIVLTRAGALHMVSAEACAMLMSGKTDTKMDGCMKGYDPKMVYGQSDSFSIYAKAKDSQGTMVVPDTFMVKPVTMDDYGDATKAFNIPTAGKNLPSGGLDVDVKKDAPHGKYLLDVIATTGTGSKKITQSDRVMITVSGPLDMYYIEGPERIQPGQVVTYTVHAQDELGNPADYADGQSEMADVFVDANPATIQVRLLDLGNGMLDLSGDSKASFRLRVPPGTVHGTLTITVADKNKDVQDAFKDVRIGSNRAPMAGAAIADQMVDVGEMVSVQSTIADPDSDMLSWSVMSSDEMVATAMVDDMGMVKITAIGVGTATVTVTATDSNGSSAMQEIMVTVEEVNVAPMAGEAIDPVMMTMGDDPMMVATMFTDANADDMLSYSVMSSDEMVATAMVDDMGEVTITAVGAGTATVTVTATDSDGLSAMQDIMVTVMSQMLGTPSVSSAMSDSAGMATISIMPAANADSHYIWALPTDYSSNADGMFSGEAAGDATSITMSRLTSGKSYWFTVVAGMDMDDGPTEWAWATGWTGATAIR